MESKHARPFNQNNTRLYIATLLYRGVAYKPICHMYCTNDKIFETPGSRKIISQNKVTRNEKYIHFLDISALAEGCLSKVHPIHEYIVERWQSLLILGRDISIDEALLLWKG